MKSNKHKIGSQVGWSVQDQIYNPIDQLIYLQVMDRNGSRLLGALVDEQVWDCVWNEVRFVLNDL